MDTSNAPGLPAADSGGRVPYRALALATGETHVCAILDDHNVKCWGHNSFGQLGYGDTQSRGRATFEMGDALPIVDLGTARAATAVAASRYTSCAILDDGSLRCWGWHGLSGSGSANEIGDQPGEMGDHLAALDFGGRRPVHVAMGDLDACASMDDDTIWCWGESEVGGRPKRLAELPLMPVRMLGPAAGGVIAVYEDGTLSPVLPGQSAVLAFDRKVVSVAGSGNAPPCVLFDDGSTACHYGDSDRAWPAGVIAIGCERDGGLCAVLSDGTVTCRSQSCVQPSYYQCADNGAFSLGAPAVAVTSNGSEFACGLLADGNVKCWGASSTPAWLPSPWFGASIDVTQTRAGLTYAWHTIDLGGHLP
ncbi:MAG TPA: RCC1 domain-containing protein [Polyangia bacterium]|nr:RCC1 domain-containing protein [Polyangia bacterium]